MMRPPFPLPWALLTAAALSGALACTEDARDEAAPRDAGVDAAAAAPFRVLVLTDTHIIGPQYTCCQENSPADNASIMRTVERLQAVRDTVASMNPPPVMGFLLGDVVHDAYHSGDIEFYRSTSTAFSVARDLLRSFSIPIHVLFGNHDYARDCAATTDYRDFSHQLFQEFFEQPPYQAIDHGGFKFLLTNGQLGPTWQPGHPDCGDSVGSYGREQLGWVDSQLLEGKPTFVMSHYMRLVTKGNEDPSGPFPDLPTLLDSHDNVQAFLVGHTHRWLDQTAFNFGKPHWVVGATRYDADNFWVIELDPRTGSWTILDRDKIQPTSSCADTWSYSGTPAPVAGAPETGDCVIGMD
ncbi:MAG: metallophosphoesterase [Polyangiaceae bacterium]|nr:metallophosphoesterase [Polyangiaceae bacterium]